jgi:hypothetical protein
VIKSEGKGNRPARTLREKMTGRLGGNTPLLGCYITRAKKFWEADLHRLLPT